MTKPFITSFIVSLYRGTGLSLPAMNSPVFASTVTVFFVLLKVCLYKMGGEIQTSPAFII